MAQHTTAAFQLITRIDSLHSPRDIPLHTNIVFICSCRDCVVPLTHAFQVSWLARYALHARLPGSTRLKTTQVAALAALKDRIVFGITVPALSCSNTSARSGYRSQKKFSMLPTCRVTTRLTGIESAGWRLFTDGGFKRNPDGTDAAGGGNRRCVT